MFQIFLNDIVHFFNHFFLWRVVGETFWASLALLASTSVPPLHEIANSMWYVALSYTIDHSVHHTVLRLSRRWSATSRRELSLAGNDKNCRCSFFSRKKIHEGFGRNRLSWIFCCSHDIGMRENPHSEFFCSIFHEMRSKMTKNDKNAKRKTHTKISPYWVINKIAFWFFCETKKSS